jgi:hypothetical protein
MGMDRIRSAVEGLDEVEIAVDWGMARLAPVVANEKIPFVEGETRIVPIRPIKIPAYGMVLQSFYGANGMGHISCVGALEYKSYTEERVANMAMFQSRLKASVMKGDMLGQILIVPEKKA